jgi:CubicO group peptidase (beta-lactamase class C family)
MLRQQIGTPAVAVAVMSSQATLESGVSGLRIVNGTAQVTPADLWHLGSNTKAMTAALAGVLVQRGQIKWDTTLADVLPNQPGVLPVYEAVTLEELLSHRAGVIPLTEFNSLPEFTGDFHQRRLEFVSWALSQTAGRAARNRNGLLERGLRRRCRHVGNRNERTLGTGIDQ